MKRLSTRARRIRAAIIALLAGSAPAVGFASGKVSFVDRMGVISFNAQKAIEAEAASWPFDTTIYVNREPVTTEDFDNLTRVRVYGSHVVSIGINPDLRHTAVFMSKDVGARKRDYEAIAMAGNGRFARGDYAGGVIQIGKRILVSFHTTSPVRTKLISTPSTAENTSTDTDTSTTALTMDDDLDVTEMLPRNHSPIFAHSPALEDLDKVLEIDSDAFAGATVAGATEATACPVCPVCIVSDIDKPTPEETLAMIQSKDRQHESDSLVALAAFISVAFIVYVRSRR